MVDIRGIIKSYKKTSKGMTLQIEIEGNPDLKEINRYIDDKEKINISIGTSQMRLE